MKRGRTFVEKILKAGAGDIVYAEPDLVLTQDNSARIKRIFEGQGGENIRYPERLVVVLDRKMTGPTEELARDYNAVHCFMQEQSVDRFFDCDKGICHQVLVPYLKDGMLVVGNDSHTCTAGAFNCLAVGLDKTETALVWKNGDMWFRVPETVRFNLRNRLSEGVYAKDLGIWILGLLRTENILYHSLEFHGEGVKSLSVSDRMTIANMAAEMGQKNLVFPPDDVLADYFGDYAVKGIWSDANARFCRVFDIDLSSVMPMAMSVGTDVEVKSVKEWGEIQVQQGMIGGCSAGRLEDLRLVARILKGKRLAPGFQLAVVPASREIYMQALQEGLIDIMYQAGALILGSSCAPCLGSSHMLLAETERFITTTNSNSQLRMASLGIEKFVASPATVAMTALNGRLAVEVEGQDGNYPYWLLPVEQISVHSFDNRRFGNVWNYKEIDHISCGQMLAEEWSSRLDMDVVEKKCPYLLNGLDVTFASRVQQGDILVAGEDFGCGKLDASVPEALHEAGIKAVIVRSAERRFYRLAMENGLPVLIMPEVVSAYRSGSVLELDLDDGKLRLEGTVYRLPAMDMGNS